jgi:hypothetical protein
MSQAVQTVNETPVELSATTIIQVIERAAANPNVDIDKMERLLQMHERVTARGAETAFNEAMNAAQAKIGPVVARAKNSQTNSKYATFAALDKVIRPIYVASGFSLSFNTAAGAPDNHIRVTCTVAHVAGHSREYQVDMPADGKGAKGGDVMTKTHAAGAAMTYGQRYLVKLIFNLAIATDHDGNDASAKPSNPRASVAPEGADFWDCEGPGMSAHAAKAAGVDKIHERLREEIAMQFSTQAMNAWIDANLSNIQQMPRSWRVILRQEVDEQAATFSGAGK